MRRFFTKKPKTNQSGKKKQKREKPGIRAVAMEQLRETREKLTRDHPELMKRVQKQVLRAQKQAEINIAKDALAQAGQDDDLSIDKQKNVSTVLQLLEIKDETPDMNPAFHGAIKAILAKHIH